MTAKKKKIEDLAKKIKTPDQPLIIMDWGPDDCRVNGEKMTRAECERRYGPPEKIVEWDKDEN